MIERLQISSSEIVSNNLQFVQTNQVSVHADGHDQGKCLLAIDIQTCCAGDNFIEKNATGLSTPSSSFCERIEEMLCLDASVLSVNSRSSLG